MNTCLKSQPNTVNLSGTAHMALVLSCSIILQGRELQRTSSGHGLGVATWTSAPTAGLRRDFFSVGDTLQVLPKFKIKRGRKLSKRKWRNNFVKTSTRRKPFATPTTLLYFSSRYRKDSIDVLNLNQGKQFGFTLTPMYVKHSYFPEFCGSVVAERLWAPNSNSGVSNQQSVGSNPQPWHLCP